SQVWVESASEGEWVETRSEPQKQDESVAFETRISLQPGSDRDEPIDEELRVRVACSTHGEHMIVQQIPDNIFEQLSTPDWAKGLVWYQGFPERFRDGNPQNNPNNWDLKATDWNEPFAESTQEEIERGWNRRLVDPRQFRGDANRAGGSAASL